MFLFMLVGTSGMRSLFTCLFWPIPRCGFRDRQCLY